MDYTTTVNAKGKKTVLVGRVEKDYDKITKSYKKLYEQGFSILGVEHSIDNKGLQHKVVKMRVSNVYLCATENKDGNVHYFTKTVKTNGFSDSTAAFKVSQKASGFKNAKAYLLKAFGKDLTWEEFDRITTQEYATQIEEARQVKAQKEAESQAQKERIQEILSNIAI